MAHLNWKYVTRVLIYNTITYLLFFYNIVLYDHYPQIYDCKHRPANIWARGQNYSAVYNCWSQPVTVWTWNTEH